MRKTILETTFIGYIKCMVMNIILSVCISLLPSQVMAAVDCQTTPSCEALGYTYSVSECDGRPVVKCPFDQTKLFCDKKNVSSLCSPGNIYHSSTSICDNIYSGSGDYVILSNNYGVLEVVSEDGFVTNILQGGAAAARQSAVTSCGSKYQGKGTLITNAEHDLVRINANVISESVATGNNGSVVTKDGCFQHMGNSYSGCTGDEAYGALCKTTIDIYSY